MGCFFGLFKNPGIKIISRREKYFFAPPQVAWCLSIVGQAAKATCLQNIDGSGAVFRIVALSEIKAVELDVQY